MNKTKIAVISEATSQAVKSSSAIHLMGWNSLEGGQSISDHDFVIIDLNTFPSGFSRSSELAKVISLKAVSEVLSAKGVFIVIGDARKSFLQSGEQRTVLSIIGLEASWSNTSGDRLTPVKSNSTQKIDEWAQRISRWEYSLEEIGLRDSLIRELGSVHDGTNSVKKAYANCIPIYSTRFGKPVLFAVEVAIPNPAYLASGQAFVKGVGYIFLPKSSMSPSDQIDFVIQDICGVNTTQEVPEWLEAIVVPGQQEIESKIAHARVAIALEQSHLEEALSEKSAVRECLKLVYTNGSELEGIVRSILQALGAIVKAPDESGHEDGWIQWVEGDTTYRGVIEVKATSKPQFDEQGLRQVFQWVSNGIENEHVEYKGIFIGNHSMNIELDKRSYPFSDSFVRNCELRKCVAITTVDLLEAYSKDIEGKLDRALFWKSIFCTNGIWTPSWTK